jgi:hypothetical protein
VLKLVAVYQPLNRTESMESRDNHAMEAPPTLSPKGTLQLLLAILDVDAFQPLNQATLKDLGITQNKHANKLLSYLGLRTTTGTLTDDVLECRHDPARLAALLRDRLVAACVRSGCTQEQLAFLGCERLDPKELKEKLAGLPLIRGEMTAATRASVVGCISTLSDVLASGSVSRLALERRLGIRSKNEPAVRPTPARCYDSASVFQSRLRQPILVASGEIKREYILDYQDNKPIRVSVTFDRLLDSTYLERLGNLLIGEAQAMQCAQPSEEAIAPANETVIRSDDAGDHQSSPLLHARLGTVS